MFSLIFLQLYSTSALKVATLEPIFPKLKLKKGSKPAEKIIHKDGFLDKAIKGFMTHNHEIISIHHDLSASMYDYNKERGKVLPQFNLVGSLSDQQSLGARSDSEKDKSQNSKNTSVNYGLEATYTLFDGFSSINAVRSKDFEVQAKLYNGLSKISKKLLDFIQLILTIQETEFKVEIATRDVQRKEKMYKEAKNRVVVGAASKQDEFQALAALDEALGRKGDAELDLKSTKSQFLEWTSLPYQKLPWIGIPEEFLTNFDNLEATIHKNNNEILQAQADMRSKEKKQKAVNSAAFSPRFELSFGAKNVIGKGSISDPNTNELIHSINRNTQMDLSTNLQCKVPLWSGGANKSAALQASKEVAAARHSFYSATQDTKIAFQNQKQSLLSAQNDHQLYKSIADNYQKSYDIAFDKYQSGALNFTDLAEVADRLNRAELMLAQKDKERRKTAWELTRTLGNLTPSKLCGCLHKTFDPLSEYNKVKSRI